MVNAWLVWDYEFLAGLKDRKLEAIHEENTIRYSILHAIFLYFLRKHLLEMRETVECVQHRMFVVYIYDEQI